MNDPNGLCFRNGLWHAYYQHDPYSDTHDAMHWAHASSRDLVHWDHHPVALHPDEQGMIFSGSVVIDGEDTAGFGAGAMVAVFTHYLDGRQHQSLAVSRDGGFGWEKYSGNPVLEAPGEKDFRDPKVVRTATGWLMALAVGDRIDFYSSPNLRSWEPVGSYQHALDAAGVWECPDLIRIPTADDRWALTFSVMDGGPLDHGGVLIVDGHLTGDGFEPVASPKPFDHGPDFYAAQSFHAVPEAAAVFMGWMGSWRYSRIHPSRGRRGVQSLPRILKTSPTGFVVVPAIDIHGMSEPIEGSQWDAVPGHGAIVVATAGTVISLVNHDGAVATVELTETACALTRHGDVVDGYAQRYEAELTNPGPHTVVADHGTLEVFTGGGETLSALIFAGEQWAVDIDGPAAISVL